MSHPGPIGPDSLAVAELERYRSWLGLLARLQVEPLAAPGSSPSEQAGRHELELRLTDALARLPADYAEILLMRNVEGLSHEEAAQRMGRGIGAVRMLWVRALNRLRQELDLQTDTDS